MSVYLVEAAKASCRVSGCVCRDRGPRYPSDATDAEWELLGPQARAVMADLRRSPGGRPMDHDLRAVLDAIRYVTRYGIEWRALPVDFPPWEAVYAFFERWSARGLPQGLADRLRGRLRVAYGRADLPTAGSIDSQSVKAADTVGAASRGFDAGKKINGRKRHIAVDTLGLVLTVMVTAASVQDRDGAHRLLALLRERYSTITLVWADGGYAGRLVSWAHTVLALTVTIVKRSEDTTGFVVLPRRWVVERTFGWLLRYRRLVRDYERRPEHHEAMVLWATIAIMTRQLARTTASAPPPPRWGGPRAAASAPEQQVTKPRDHLPTGSQHSGVDPGGQRRRRRATLPAGSRLVKDDKLEPDAEGDVRYGFHSVRLIACALMGYRR
jgi:transposase